MSIGDDDDDGLTDLCQDIYSGSRIKFSYAKERRKPLCLQLPRYKTAYADLLLELVLLIQDLFHYPTMLNSSNCTYVKADNPKECRNVEVLDVESVA